MKRLTPEEIAIALEEIINALARLEARVAKCEQPTPTVDNRRKSRIDELARAVEEFEARVAKFERRAEAFSDEVRRYVERAGPK